MTPHDLHRSILALREAYGQARLALVKNGRPDALLDALDAMQAALELLDPAMLALLPVQRLLALAFRQLRAAPAEAGKYAGAVMVFFHSLKLPWVEEAGLHGALYDAV